MTAAASPARLERDATTRWADGAGPLALGALADATGVVTAFLLVPALPAAAAVASWETRIA